MGKYPGKFLVAVALLPQNDVDAAQKEVERAVTKLGMRGILLHSSVNGESLDLPKFRPLYAQMAEYDLPIFIHPSLLTGKLPSVVEGLAGGISEKFRSHRHSSYSVARGYLTGDDASGIIGHF